MEPTQLQDLFSEFLRALGLQRPSQVPAGFSITLSEMFALLALVAEEPLAQQTLADRLQLDKSTVSRLVKTLEQRGWVQRERDPQDTRSFHVSLSEAGHETATQLTTRLSERHEHLLAALKPEEQTALAYGLSALIRALRTV